MGKVLVIMSLLFSSISCFAIQEKDIHLLGGLGWGGSRGIFGFSGERFYTPNHALSWAFGGDYIGATTTMGYKYFTEDRVVGDSAWQKCLFVFKCSSHYYFGGGIQYAGKTEMTVSENDIEVRRYETSPQWLAIGSLGIRNILKNNMTFDLEVSYKSKFAGGKSIQTFGEPDGSDDRALKLGQSTMGINLAIGYAF